MSTPAKTAKKAAQRVVDDLEFSAYPDPTKKQAPPVPAPVPVASGPPPQKREHPPTEGYDGIAAALAKEDEVLNG